MRRLGEWLLREGGRGDQRDVPRSTIAVRCSKCRRLTELRSSNSGTSAEANPILPESWVCAFCGSVNHKTLSQRLDEGESY